MYSVANAHVTYGLAVCIILQQLFADDWDLFIRLICPAIMRVQSLSKQIIIETNSFRWLHVDEHVLICDKYSMLIGGNVRAVVCRVVGSVSVYKEHNLSVSHICEFLLY